jgi:hypothetical protein
MRAVRGADGLVAVSPEDSKPLLGIGWLIQSDLEKC